MRSIRIAIDPELDNNRGCWRDKTLGLVSVGWELRQNTLVIWINENLLLASVVDFNHGLPYFVKT